jgi:hypothetical protein
MKYAIYGKLEKITGQNLNDASGLTVTVRFTKKRVFDLPLLPVTSITSATYYAEDDSSTALVSGTHYKKYGQTGARLGSYTLDFFNYYKDIEVVYVSNGSTIPYDFKVAVLGWLKKIWNDDRNFVGEIVPPPPPKETMYLISPYIKVHI